MLKQDKKNGNIGYPFIKMRFQTQRRTFSIMKAIFQKTASFFRRHPFASDSYWAWDELVCELLLEKPTKYYAMMITRTLVWYKVLLWVQQWEENILFVPVIKQTAVNRSVNIPRIHSSLRYATLALHAVYAWGEYEFTHCDEICTIKS